MKKSNILLFLFLSVLALMYISFALNASGKITDNYINSNKWVEADSIAINDTILVPYSHLVCEFPVTTLDARYADQLVLTGFESGKSYASAKVINDTLYLKHIPKYEGDFFLLRRTNASIYSQQKKYSSIADGKVNGKYPFQINVGSKKLKSITVGSNGKISILDNPIAKKKDEPIYAKEVHPIHFHEFVEIDIHLKKGGNLELFMHANTVNLTTEKTGGFFDFQGKINRFNILNPGGNFRVPSFINVDSAYVYSPKEESMRSSGILRLNCTKYLYAELHHNLDIYYQGNPTIEKTETNYGRVVNSNSRPDIEDQLNTIQREAHKIPTEEEKIEIRKRNQRDSLNIIAYRDSINSLRLDPSELIK